MVGSTTESDFWLPLCSFQIGLYISIVNLISRSNVISCTCITHCIFVCACLLFFFYIKPYSGVETLNSFSFVCYFTSRSRIFPSHEDVIIEGDGAAVTRGLGFRGLIRTAVPQFSRFTTSKEYWGSINCNSVACKCMCLLDCYRENNILSRIKVLY